jgi:virginiamycin B lyase
MDWKLKSAPTLAKAWLAHAAIVAVIAALAVQGSAAPQRIHYTRLQTRSAPPIAVQIQVRNAIQTDNGMSTGPNFSDYIGTVRTIVTAEPSGDMTGLSLDPAGKIAYASFPNRVDKIILSSGQAVQFATGLCGGPTAFDNASKLLYEYDPCQFAMKSIDRTGTVTFLAGGSQGTNDGTGSAAQFEGVTGITIDPTTDTLFVSDGNAARQVTTGGTVTTLAQIYRAAGIAFDTADRNLYVVSANCTDIIEKVTLAGTVSWFSGRSLGCFYQEDGPPNVALFSSQSEIVYSAKAKAFLVADTGNNQIREVFAAGNVTTLAGSGIPALNDGVGNRAGFYLPQFIAMDPNSPHLYVGSREKLRVVTTRGPKPPPPMHGIALMNPPTVPNGLDGVAAASNGSVWFTEATSNKIGFTRRGAMLHEIPLPGGFGSPGQMILGGDGNVWFIDSNPPGIPPPNNYLAKVTGAGQITEFGVSARALTRGSDGNVWFVGSGVGFITPSGDVTEYYATPFTFGITTGFDGNIWTFADPIADQGEIDRISTMGVLLNRYIIHRTQTFITSLVAGSDRRMWFVTDQGNQIGAMTLGGQATFYNLPGNRTPANLTLGSDGAVWFTEGGQFGTPGAIGRITTSGKFREFLIPTPRSGPSALTVAPDGKLWFADPSAHKLGHVF